MKKTKTQIAAFVTAALTLSLNIAYAQTADVQIELSFPKTTYGLGAWQVEKNGVSDCSLKVDNTDITNALSNPMLSMNVGTHDFSAKCFGSGTESTRQQYFGSLVKSQTVISGTQNKVTLQMLAYNPRTVLTKIDSPEVSPGLQYFVKLLNGEKPKVTLDQNSSFSMTVHNDNPPIEIYSTNDVKIGDLTYEKYSFPLFSTKTVGIALSTQPVSVDVRLGNGSDFIYDPNVGLIINDQLSNESVVNFTVPNVPQGNYEVRITNEKGEIVFPYGEIVNTSNFKYIFGVSNNLLSLQGTTDFTFSFKGMNLEQKYRIVLILQKDDL